MEALVLVKEFFTNPKNAIMTAIAFTAVASFGKFMPKKKLENVLNIVRKWCSETADKIRDIALSPMYGIGLLISKTIIGKIGKTAGDAIEDVISTLMVFAIGVWNIVSDTLLRPVIGLPSRMIERIMEGMLSDNKNKKGVKK